MIYSIFYLTNALSVAGVLALSTSWFYSFSHVSSERKTEIPSLLEIGNSGSSFYKQFNCISNSHDDSVNHLG